MGGGRSERAPIVFDSDPLSPKELDRQPQPEPEKGAEKENLRLFKKINPAFVGVRKDPGMTPFPVGRVFRSAGPVGAAGPGHPGGRHFIFSFG